MSIQPFARPFRQWAWTCELLQGECFEDCPGLVAVFFEHSAGLASRVRTLAERDGPLFPPDVLADTASVINASRRLPAAFVEAAARHLKFAYPIDQLGSIQDALHAAGYDIVDAVPPVLAALRTPAFDSSSRLAASAWSESAAKHWRQWFVRNHKVNRNRTVAEDT